MDISYYLYVIAVFLFIVFVYMFCHSRAMDLERRISLSRIQVNRMLADNGRRLSQIGLQIERQFSLSGDRLDPREIASEVRRRSTLENISDGERKHRDNQAKQGDNGRLLWTPPSGSTSDVNEVSSIEQNSTISEDISRKQEDVCPIVSVKMKEDSKDELKTTQGAANSDGNQDDGKESRDSFPSTCFPSELTDGHQQPITEHHDKDTVGEPILESPMLTRIKQMPQGPYNSTSVHRRDSIMPVFNTPKTLPRRKSVFPVLTEEPAAVARRTSICQATTSPLPSIASTRKDVVLVKPPAYVCPRRSSVLFNSTLFAHTPGRRMSKLGRDESNNADENPPSQATVGQKQHCLQESIEELDGSSNANVWQKSTVSRSRRRSSTGAIYNSRRASIITNSTEDIPATEKNSTPMSPLSFFRGQSTQERRQSIPKLKGNYLTGNLTEFKTVFGPNAHEELTAKNQRFGPVYQINALGQKIVFLFDHKDIDALKKAEGKCPKHMDFKHLRIYRQRNNLPLGVLLSSGEDWKRQRKILSKAMSSTVVQLQYIPVINQVAKEAVGVISNKLIEEPLSEVYMPEVDVNNYAVEAFGRVLYGRDLKCLSSNTDTDLHKFVEIAKSNFEDAKALMTLPSCLMLLHPAWRRHNEKWNFLLETSDTCDVLLQLFPTTNSLPAIKQALLSIHCDKKTPCVLSHLMNKGEMTESEMLVNLTDLLLASIDTTSTAIHWCLFELAKHPKSVTHIVDNYRQYVGDSTEVTMDHLHNMTYLKAVVKETLRLHPVGFLACRTISKQMTVREYNVQPQANVAACMYVMGRSKQLVQDPEMFKPQRWLNDSEGLDRFYKDVPFGFGARMCLGKRIAEIEIALFLLHFCVNFEFRLTPTCHIDHTVKLLLVPSRPLELYIKGRKE